MAATYGIINLNGSRYALSYNMISPNSSTAFHDVDKNNSNILVSDNVECMEIVHDIMNPLLSGYMIYKDNEVNLMGKYINRPYVYCMFLFGKILDGKSQVDVTQTFKHIFLVNNISIIKKEKNLTTYRLEFISENWWKFSQNINFSTQGKIEKITSIMKQIFAKYNLTLDTTGDTSNAKLSYMTSANDNIFSAYDYLLNRLYSNSNKDASALEFIIYNQIKDRYEYFNLASSNPKNTTPNDVADIDNIFISIDNEYLNTMFNNGEPVLNVINFKPKTEMIDNIGNTIIWKYDYTTNAFSKDTLDTDTLTTHIASKMDNQYKKKYYNYKSPKRQISIDDANLNYVKEDAEWVRTINLYNNVVSNFLNNNVVSVTTTGYLKRHPGMLSNLIIDNTNTDTLIDLNGSWINLRTKHTIKKDSYTNTVLLGRVAQ